MSNNLTDGVDLTKAVDVSAGVVDAGKFVKTRTLDGKIDSSLLTELVDADKQFVPQLSDLAAVSNNARLYTLLFGSEVVQAALVPPTDAGGARATPFGLQTALWSKPVAFAQGFCGSNVVNGTAGATAQGTATARTLATTNILTDMQRLGYVSSGAAGQSAGITLGVNVRRGNGFFFHAKFGFPQIASTSRVAIGLMSNVNLSTDPSAATSSAMFACNAADANLQFMSKASSGTVAKADLGFVAKAANVVLEVFIAARAGSNNLFYGYRRLDNVSAFPKPNYTVAQLAANIPLIGDVLTPVCLSGTGAALTAVNTDVRHVYVETDN